MTVDSSSIETLSPSDVGVWEVETQGSTHTWDIRSDGEVYYSRHPGPNSLAGAFAYDGVAHRLSWVEQWPKVGSRSLVWYDDPEHPQLVEQYRLCSTIKSIRRVAA